MYGLEFFNKKSEELVATYELSTLSDHDVFGIVGFELRGNCAELSFNQIISIENIINQKINISIENNDVFLVEIEG